jgi:hypothetical protein
MHAGGVDRLGQRHLRQDRREASRQPRGPRPRGTQQEDVVVKTPASDLALPLSKKEHVALPPTRPYRALSFSSLTSGRPIL